MNTGRLVQAFAGLQAGILSGLAALGWFLFASLASGDSIWLIPNIFASVFYGARSLRADFGLYTCSGAALHLLLSALLGIVFAFLVPSAWSWRRSLMVALIYVGLLHVFSISLVWTRFNPWLISYVSPGVLWMAYLVLGGGFSTIPSLVRSMRKDFLLK